MLRTGRSLVVGVCAALVAVTVGLTTMPAQAVGGAEQRVDTPSSSIYAWGDNRTGQLGNGTKTASGTPGTMALPAGVAPVLVSAGSDYVSAESFSLAIGSDRRLYAWGRNAHGELGDGTSADKLTPVRVGLPDGVAATVVASGGHHGLAIGDDGELYSWGDNTSGQLGIGSLVSSSTPAVVTLPTGVHATTVSAGLRHTLAIGDDGLLYSWGDNSTGQLGTGSTTGSTTPKVVALPTGVRPVTVAAGLGFSLAIGDDGKLYAWGDNQFGQLGDGTSTSRTRPQVVSLPAGVAPAAISAGYGHSVAIGDDRRIYTWGFNNFSQLGNDTTTNTASPAPLVLPAGVAPRSISAGSTDTFMTADDGTVYGWGDNRFGQLGIDTSGTSARTPVTVTIPGGAVRQLSAGAYHTLAITSSDTIAPSATLEVTSGQASGPLTVTVTFSEAVFALAARDFVVGNGTATAVAPVGSAGDVYVVTVTRAVSGPITIDLPANRVSDAAGNLNTAAPQVLVKGTQTVAFTSQPPEPANVGGTYAPEAEASSEGPVSFAVDPDTTNAACSLAAGQVSFDAVGTCVIVGVQDGSDSYEAAQTTQSFTVEEGTFTPGLTVTVTGTPTVGGTLTATPAPTQTGATTPTADSFSYAWSADGDPVADATDSTVTLTSSMVGKAMAVTVTAHRAGYHDLVATSDSTDRVAGGTITLAVPAIAGLPVVGVTLTASTSDVEPAGAKITYTWTVADRTTSGDTYTVSPADVGHVITVTAKATASYHDDASATSLPTAEVSKAAFTTAPVASFTGSLQVGQTLTADPGTPMPTPDSYEYQWSASGEPIDGGTGATFVLTSAQKGKPMAVTVTAVREGYQSSSSTSASSAAVASRQAPDISLTASPPQLRLGASTTLRWETTDADAVTASGDWSAARPLSGTQTVTPSSTGAGTYILTATNGSGSTSAQVSVSVALPAAKLSVSAAGTVIRGKKLRIRASGLAPGERYTATIGGVRVKAGTASRAGTVSLSIRVSSAVKPGRRDVRITGSLNDRTGRDSVRIVRLKDLALRVARDSVRASDRQTVRVRHLQPGERVTIRYDGQRISPKSARADRAGVYTQAFAVGTSWGQHTVTAAGQLDGRTGSKRFVVRDRCPGAAYFCD